MSDVQPRYRCLLRPEDCVIVLVGNRRWDGTAAALFLQAAEIHGVPAIALLDEPATKAPPSCTAVRCFHINPFDDAQLRRRLASLRRPGLVIGGGRAETTLTFAVLCALEEGYDVHLLRDLVRGGSESLTDIAVARMIQAGAVPVSTVQVIAEWGCGVESASDVGKMAPAA